MRGRVWCFTVPTHQTGRVARSGAPLAGVSRAMGHSEISTTMKHYYHLLGGEVEAAMATLPEIGAGRKKAGKVVRMAG